MPSIVEIARFAAGKWIIFYKRNMDSKKYRFYIPNNDELTKIIEKGLKHKKFTENEAYAMIDKIAKIIESLKKTDDTNPIVELSQYCQIHLKGNIETCVSIVGGTGHAPIIKADLILPNGDIFSAEGKNQKEAKQKAAIDALKKYKNWCGWHCDKKT